MDTFESKSPEQSTGGETQQQLDSIRHLVVSVLVLVLVVSGTLNIFFLRQMRDVKRDLERVGPQATQIMANYQKTEAPMMQTLLAKFTEYGRAHPDYAPILAKYGIKQSGATNAPAPAAATEKK